MLSSAVTMPALFGKENRVCAIETHTLISAQLDVSKQTNFDDLPKQAQNKMRFAFSKVQSPDVDHMTANGRGGVKSQVKILLQDRSNDLC